MTLEEGVSVITPAQASVRVGLDVGKDGYFAAILDDAGERLLAPGPWLTSRPTWRRHSTGQPGTVRPAGRSGTHSTLAATARGYGTAPPATPDALA